MLSVRERLVIEMRILEEASTASVGRALGLSIGNVREIQVSDKRPGERDSSEAIFTPRLLIGPGAVAMFLIFFFQNSAIDEIGLLRSNATAPIWAFFIIVFALGWIESAHRRTKKQ